MFANKNIFKEIAGIFTGNIAAVFFGFLSGIILSRVLGPELKGVYSTLIVIPGIISSVIMLGSRPSVIYHTGKKLMTNQQIVSATFFLWMTSSIIGIIVFIGAYWLLLDKVYTTLMILLVILYIPAKLVITHSGSIFLANLKFKKANMMKWLTALLTLITIFIFVFVLRLSVTGALLALYSATFTVMAIAIVTIAKDYGIKIRFDSHVIKQIYKMGLIYALALFIIQLNYRIDILILNLLSSKEEIGIYTVGVSVAEKLLQLPVAIGIVLISRSAATINLPAMVKDTSRLLRLSFLIILIASVILFLIVPWIVPLIYGSAFARSAQVIQNILPGICFFVIVRILSSSIAGFGKPWVMLAIFIPTLILNIILNFLWIPDYGCIGSAWATNVSYISGSIAVLFVFSYITKTPVRAIIAYQREDFMFRKFYKEFKKRKKNARANIQDDQENLTE